MPLLLANARKEFPALRAQPAGLGCDCGCGGGCGCGSGLGDLIPVQASSIFPALAARPAGMGQITTTSAPSFSFATAPAGSLVIAGQDVSWLENTVALFGYSVPVWILGAGALGVAWLMNSMSGGKRRR